MPEISQEELVGLMKLSQAINYLAIQQGDPSLPHRVMNDYTLLNTMVADLKFRLNLARMG